MSFDLQDLLARRADAVEPPVFDPLAVVARGERRIRRRNRITAAGAALALAVSMGVTALVVDRGQRPDWPRGPSRWRRADLDARDPPAHLRAGTDPAPRHP